jgi:hypothetical protein
MVYVDDFKACEGQRFMYHLIADTAQELREAARNLGLSYNCIRNSGKYNEHLYISATKRNCAISQGAKAITSQEMVNILKQKPTHPERKWETFLELCKATLDNNHEPNS